MSTPTPPVPRLPNKPTSSPAAAQDSREPHSSSDETGHGQVSPALERLRAGRPKIGLASGPTAEHAPGSIAAPAPDAGPRPPAGERRSASRAAARRAARGSSTVIQSVRSWDPDLVRRIAVTIVVIGSTLGTANAAGAFGGPDIREASLGTFDPAATLVSPAFPAPYLWLVIGAGLLGYTAHQWLPSQRRSPRHRVLGWLVVASLLVTLAWALTLQQANATASLVLIWLLVVLLLGALRWLNRYPAQTRTEAALVDVPLGLFLGWAGVTAVVHTGAVLTVLEVDWLGWGAQRWALIGVILLILAAMAVCMTDRGRIAVAMAVVWGVTLIVPERLFGDLQSTPVAFAAGLGVFFLIISAGSRRHRVDHAYRRELRARQMATVAPIDFYDDGEPAGSPL
ncbi:hypothetical protein ACX80Z_14965 [Arthrobacter sp. TMT4-20]